MKLITFSVPVRFTIKTDRPQSEILDNIRTMKKKDIDVDMSLYDGTTGAHELDITDVIATVSEAAILSETEYRVRYYGGNEFTPDESVLERYNRFFSGIFTEAYRSRRERFLLYRNDGEVVLMGSGISPEIVTSEVMNTKPPAPEKTAGKTAGKKVAKKPDGNW